MKANFSSVIFFVCLILILSTVLVVAEFAYNTGEVRPMYYTTTDIYNLIHSIDTAVEGDHSFSPTTSPTATSSYSISQLYADLANLIKRENVATGTVYLGVTGDYGNPDPVYATTSVIASSLTPHGSPGDPTGYSLEDICNLINNNTTTTAAAHASSPSGPPNNSMCNLVQIYELLSQLGVDKAPFVAEGVTYLGVAGEYSPEFCGGDGSEGNPYQICNWAQLNNIRYYLINSYFVLNNNLDVDTFGYDEFGADWQPIGNPSNKFAGTLNGQNYTISDLTINLPETGYVGLFGFSMGSISNLGLVDVNIFGGNAVGGLVGALADSDTLNSYVTGSVNGLNAVGGLVGSIGSHSGITNSYSLASVEGSSAVGGLAGQCSMASISNSYSTGLIVGGDGDGRGGLIGLSSFGCTVNYSFWDIETSGMLESALGTGTTTSAMYQQETFTDWDFDSVWIIDEGSSYPYLQ
jgi:hypothetical protein